MSRPEKKTYTLSNFFANHLDNLGSVFLVNLFLFGGLAVFGTLFMLTAYLGNQVNLFAMFLVFPIMSPLFAGAFYIS